MFQNVKSDVCNMLKHTIKKQRLYLCNEFNNVIDDDLPAKKWDEITLPLVKIEKEQTNHDTET